MADDDLKIIELQPTGKVSKKYEEDKSEVHRFEITNEVLVETFYHEVSHIILDAIGETKLSEDEALVNMLGKAWLEIYLSSTYEKDSKKEV